MLLEQYAAVMLEGVGPPGEQAAVGRLRGVDLAHHAEGVAIETCPDVKAMLFDAMAERGVAAARALAPQAPAHLIHGDVVPFSGVG